MMKKEKRVLGVMMSLCMALAVFLSGCGAADTLTEILSQKETSSEGTENTEKKQDKAETVIETETETETAEDPAALMGEYILCTQGEDLIYVLDASGEKIGTYDLSRIRESVGDVSYPFSTSGLAGISAGILYFSEYAPLDAKGNDYGISVYAYDTTEHKVYGLSKIAGADRTDLCGIYEGRFYAVVKEMGDYMVFQNTWSSGRYFTWTRSNNMWKVGCVYGTSDELIKKAYQDDESKGKHYEATVKYLENIVKIG